MTIRHHTELVTSEHLELRHVFSGRLLPFPAITTLVLAQGRVPEGDLWPELEGHDQVVRAGDVLDPRMLEEAVLEGTLAVPQGRHIDD